MSTVKALFSCFKRPAKPAQQADDVFFIENISSHMQACDWRVTCTCVQQNHFLHVIDLGRLTRLARQLVTFSLEREGVAGGSITPYFTQFYHLWLILKKSHMFPKFSPFFSNVSLKNYFPFDLKIFFSRSGKLFSRDPKIFFSQSKNYFLAIQKLIFS